MCVTGVTLAWLNVGRLFKIFTSYLSYLAGVVMIELMPKVKQNA